MRSPDDDELREIAQGHHWSMEYRTLARLLLEEREQMNAVRTLLLYPPEGALALEVLYALRALVRLTP